ncbi:hypothetical protein CR513_27297, partial [Mucuna pruriens]
MLKLKKNRNGVEGIPKAALKERLQQLQEEEDWLDFVDVYGLLVYGIMLFPQIERYDEVPHRRPLLGLCQAPNEVGMDCTPGRGYKEVNLVGAINCNPELTLRQAGYPMVLPPSEEAVASFVLHGLRIQEGEYLKKIFQAWKKVVRKGPEWGLRRCKASSSYKSWLQHRVESIFFYVWQPLF